MANYDPVTGEMTYVSNTPIQILSRMLSEPTGWIKIFLPILVLIGIFFIIKKYTKNKKILITYIVIAIIAYLLLLFLFGQYYMSE